MGDFQGPTVNLPEGITFLSPQVVLQSPNPSTPLNSLREVQEFITHLPPSLNGWHRPHLSQVGGQPRMPLAGQVIEQAHLGPIFIEIYLCMYLSITMYARICRHGCINIRISICTYVHTYMCTHTHIYISGQIIIIH